MEKDFQHPQEQAIPESASEGEMRAISTPLQVKPTKRLLQAFTSLRHRNFLLYWSGQMISSMGTWMQTIGQSWLVLELTHSAVQLGLVGALQYLPVLLFSLFGGVFADRWPKRSVLLVTQTAAMLQAFLLWLLLITGAIQLWHIYVLAVLLGITSTLDQPTRSAFVVELVGREDLLNAVALNSSLMNLARIIGPGLGGIIIAISGVSMLFLLNSLSFLAVIVALALIHAHELYAQSLEDRTGKRLNTWQSLREGLDYVWKKPAIVLVTVVVGLVLLFGANFSVILPLFATDVLHVGATGFGFLSAAIGIGSLVAALCLAWSNQQPTIRSILLGTLVFSVLEALFALSHIYLLSLALIAGIGAAETIFGAMSTTLLQSIAPDHLRGRVNSVYILFFTGSVPPGYLLAGWLSASYGAPIGLLICILFSLIVTSAGWIWRKPAEKDLAKSPLRHS